MTDARFAAAFAALATDARLEQDFGASEEKARGVSVLDAGESLTAHRAGGDDSEGYVGHSRRAGLEIGRE